jgi:WS/DGAT/MGAT family acyltransferase
VPSPTSGAGHTPSTLEESLRAAQHLLRLPGKTARNVFDTALPKVLGQLTRRNRADKRDGDKLDTHFVPHSMLNADVGRERGYVFTSLRLADVRHIKEHFAVTVNDVLLALAGGALRRYLGRREALPQAPLVATMPVSLRIEGDDELSNKITTVAVSLATDLDNPEQRLRTIHADCERAKRSAHAGGKGVIELLQSLPPLLISTLSHSLDAEQAAKLSGTNVIVSNVRASDRKLHLAGARLEALYPISLISPGLALNITSIGYGGKLDIGITLDPDALRQPWLLVEDLRSELAALLALAGKPSRKRKQAPAGKRKKVPARPRRKSGG